MKTGQSVVCVNNWNSYCRHCGMDCNPEEDSHTVVIGWGQDGIPGCGVKYTGRTSDYSDITPEKCRFHPELPWIDAGDLQSHKPTTS